MAWRSAERSDYLTEHRQALDVAFSLEQNQFNGEVHLELTVADIREAETRVAASEEVAVSADVSS